MLPVCLLNSYRIFLCLIAFQFWFTALYVGKARFIFKLSILYIVHHFSALIWFFKKKSLFEYNRHIGEGGCQNQTLNTQTRISGCKYKVVLEILLFNKTDKLSATILVQNQHYKKIIKINLIIKYHTPPPPPGGKKKKLYLYDGS